MSGAWRRHAWRAAAWRGAPATATARTTFSSRGQSLGPDPARSTGKVI